MMKGSTSIDSAVRTEDGIVDNIHDEHLLSVGNPRLYDHSYQSSQLGLWPQDALEWFVIIKAVPYGSRPRRKRSTRILVIQSPLWTEEA